MTPINLSHIPRRYIPAVGDAVIGLIIDRYGESWKVDITGPFPASLGALAFEGVTRRNRPNLQPGDLVYARIISAPRDAEPAIACTDADGKVRLSPSRRGEENTRQQNTKCSQSHDHR